MWNLKLWSIHYCKQLRKGTYKSLNNLLIGITLQKNKSEVSIYVAQTVIY